VKLMNGQFGWVNPSYVQAVVPGPELATAMIVLTTGAAVPIAGVADEVGLAVAKMIAGVMPMVQLNADGEIRES
jgi:hypothetical protein